MTPNHIDLLELNNRAFTAAVSAPGALDLAVPSCPEWTVADLVEHLGEVQIWWHYALRGGGLRPDENPVDRAGSTGLASARFG